VINVISVSYMI